MSRPGHSECSGTHSSPAMPEDGGGYWLYVLCCEDGSLYTGIALDVEARFAEHRQGKRGAKYLRGRRPVSVVYRQPVGSRSRAQRLEYRVRNLSRSRKLALIDGALRLDELAN